MLRKLFIIITAFAASASAALANTLPSLVMTANGGVDPITISAGTTLSMVGTATDPDGDMAEHWLEIQNADGAWSWEGWLTSEPWAGALVGNGYKSIKSGTYTFLTPGAYILRCTAVDSTNQWMVSNWIPVKVTAAVATTTPTSSTPVTPVVTAPVVATVNTPPTLKMFVNGATADITLTVGSSAKIEGQANDAEGNMSEHWLEIQNPAGSWSWEGWLTSEPWAGALVGSGFASDKTTEYTFNTVGTFAVRTTAIDPAGIWMISQTIHITVVAATTAAAPIAPVAPSPVVSTAPTTTTTPSTTASTTTTTSTSSSAAFAAAIFKSDGTIDSAAYSAYLSSWDHASVSARLGPTFETLNPGAADDRPTNYKPVSRFTDFTYSNRSNPFELGPPEGPASDGDYWSESGQVAYVPDDSSKDPGLDRIQVFSYYNNVFALSPRFDFASGIPHPDQQTLEPNYVAALGYSPREPVSIVRNYAMLQNEALVLYRDGLLGCAGTQTSRDWYERPYPGLLFPANKIPTGMAVTTSNEFALITLWDTTTHKGQLAVVALEAKFLAFHTWPYMGLPNQGSWSDFKLLGYVDLPMATPSSVSAVSNSWWSGPSQTAGEVLSQIDLTNPWTRAGFYDGTEPQWSMVVASKGYAIVSSKLENKAVIVDLTPIFSYVKESYLSSTDSYWKTVNTRGSGPGQWPLTFAEKPDIMPHVVWQTTVTAPTVVLAGPHIDRWSPDRQKAYIACEDGTIHILDTSPLMARYSWEIMGALGEMGTCTVGRNPTSMAFTRFIDWGLPLLPNTSSGQTTADPLNNTFYVACRGDREVDAVVTYEGKGAVYRRIRDTRMGDPVGVSVAGRGDIVTVADYNGRKILSFRVGSMTDRVGRVYRPGADGNADFEFAGELSFTGYPFMTNSANVN